MIPIFGKLSWAARWRIKHWKHTRRLELMARAVERSAPAEGLVLACQGMVLASPRTKPVILFNASTRLQGLSLNAAFSLLIAWALRLSGTPVVHYVCKAGMSRCVLGTTRDKIGKPPPCATCIQQSNHLYQGANVHWVQSGSDGALEKAIANLSLSELVNYRREGIPLGELVLPSLRWILRRHTLDGDDQTRFLLRHFIASAYHIANDFARLLDEVQPVKVIVFNGTFFPEAAARWMARKRGIPVICHEVALRPYTGFFTGGDATAYPIDIPNDFELSPSQNQQLDDYLEQRFQGNFSMAGVRFWPEMKQLSPEFVDKLSRFKQVVPVFTNVIFDTSQGHANVVFSHMFAWLDAVLKIIHHHPETFFVIRAHPDETRPGKESLESVAMWAVHNEIRQLPNVQFIDSREYVNSYELIQRSKFVMVYNSTIGLEASLIGAPVLCAGRSRFTQLPTVFFPHTPDAFQRQAEDFLAAEKLQAPQEHQHNARRFLYYQLFKSSLPFGNFIEEDEIWRGYVRLKNFDLTELSPEKSPAVAAVFDGIFNDGNFLI